MPNPQIQSLTVNGTTYNIVDNTSGYITGMTILSYGSSTWQDFINAYSGNKVVYCRASSQANPATGDQTRLAFMAYVNNPTNPTSVEFQYYRSVSTHTATQQGDQVFVYTLTSAGNWSVTTREASVEVAVGGDLTGSYSNGTYTVSGDIPSISVSQIETSGVNIADVTIDGTTTHLYAPQGGGGGSVTSVAVSNATNGGLSVSGSPITSSGTITIGHSNVLTSAQTTQAVYPIKIDKNGHISAYGSAVTIPTKTSDLTNDSGFITDVSDKVDKTYTLNGETSSINYNSGDGTVNITSTNSYETAQITTYNNSVSLYSVTSDDDPTISHPGGSSNIFLDWGALTIDAIDNNVSATHFDPAIRIEPEETTIKYVVTPTDDGDAANKQYVDDSISAITIPTITLNGSATTSPSFYAPTTAGTSGYYLKSNGSGAPTWAAISAGTDEKLKTSVTTTTGTYYYPVLTGTSSSAETKKYAEGLNFVMDNNSNWLTIGTSSKGGKLSLLKTHEAIIVLNNSMTTNTTITLPATTGTLALTSDIPSVPVTDVKVNNSSVVDVNGIAQITDSSGNLTLNGTLSVATNNIEAINQKNSAGTYRKLVAYSGSNNLAIGSSDQTSDYASVSSGTGGNTLLYGYNVIFYTGTNGSTTRSGYIDESGNWNCADGDLRVKLATTEALYTAISTAGWTSAVII